MTFLDASQNGLAVGLLGPPRLLLAGRPLQLDTRKAVALLAYLAMERGEHPRDSLAAIFWPDSDRPRALGALRRTIAALRSAGVSPWLEINRHALRLIDRPDLWVDAAELSQLQQSTETHGHSPRAVCAECRPLLVRAAELHRGEFLAGFTLADSPAFDDWQLLQQESLRRQSASVLNRLVWLHAGPDESTAAIEYARRWLQLDLLNEPAHRTLMELYARNGQRALALRQYQACVKVLEEELGVPPLEDTTALYEAIQAGDLPRGELRVAPSLARLPAPRPAQPIPMVGRQAEMAILAECLAAVRDSAHLVILQGESGVGKTRLAEEFLVGLRARQTVVLQTRSFPEEDQLAYAPIIDALRQAMRQGLSQRLEGMQAIWLSEATRLLPELNSTLPGLPQPAALADPAGKSRLYEGVHQVMGRLLGGRSPGVLFLDDLHNADSATREWLGYVLRRGAGRPLLILAAWRADGPQDLEALQAWSVSLPPERTREVRLGRLGREDLQTLLRRQQADHQPTASQIEALYRETEGLPLLLSEYLKLPEGGPAAGGLPRRVQEAFARRLASVSEAALQLLGAGAVIGRRFGLQTLRQISGRSEEEVVVGLEELLTAGLVVEQPDADPAFGPVYDFTHNRLRAAALQGLTLARSRLLHGRAAEALQAQGASAALAAQIARHLAAAGQELQAAEQYRRAAEFARSLHANAEALDHYASALALGYPEPGRLHEALGDLFTLQGSYREAARHYQAAVAFQEELPQGRLEHKLGRLLQRWGHWEQAEAHFATALSQLPETDQGHLARLYADWSLSAHRQGNPAAARQLLSKGLRAAEAAQDDPALAQCVNMLGILDRAEGALPQAEQHFQRSLEIAQRLQDPGAQIAALNNLALVLADRGDLDAARSHAARALGLCETIGDRHRQAALHSNLADLLHRAGQTEAAVSHLKRSAALFAEVGVQEGEYQPEIWKLVEW